MHGILTRAAKRALQRRHCKQAGVSLFETTFVLALFTLIGAGVLKGHGMIQSSTAKKLASEMQYVREMVYIYRERYQAIPGDDLYASRHVSGGISACSVFCGGINGADGLISGGYNSWAGTYGRSDSDEAGLFWNHVRLAGLAPGDASDPTARNAVGGRLGITSGPNLPTRPAGTLGLYSVCSSRITGDLAAMIDAQLDDGDATTGQVWAAVETNGSVIVATPASPYANGSNYTVCMAF
jgi:hypothetical protein